MLVPANFLVASSGSSLYLTASESRGCGEIDITMRLTSCITPRLSVYFRSENTLKFNTVYKVLHKKKI